MSATPAPEIKVGTRVKLGSHGTMGKVVGFNEQNGRVRVEVDDGVIREWARTSVRVVYRTFAPKGVATANARMREAVALVAAGESREAVAARYGVRVATVAEWCSQVGVAEDDQATLKRLQGGGP